MPIFLMFERVMLDHVAFTTLPVAPRSVFMRRAVVEFVTIEFWKLGFR